MMSARTASWSGSASRFRISASVSGVDGQFGTTRAGEVRSGSAKTMSKATAAAPALARFAEEALTLGEREFGGDHPYTATFLNNLAALHSAQGRYAQADPLYRRALAIQESAFGRPPPDVARTLNNLAVLYRKNRAVSLRPSRSISGRSRSGRVRSGRSTRMSPQASITWDFCTRPRVATPRPSRSISARSRSRKSAGTRTPQRRP